jgi:cytochrome c oxidase cbb3-type subunit 3
MEIIVSTLLSVYIISLVVFSILLYSYIIYVTKNIELDHDDHSSDHGHSFDGIKELNEPLPLWWLWMYVLSIIFAIGYLFLYPGFGSFKGFLSWTSHKECNQNIAKNDKLYESIYISYNKQSIEDLTNNEKALKIGRSLFVNNCSLCHGLDAKGGNGFPNLTNKKWLYGGTPNEIKTTITNGRRGKMPPYGPVLGSEIDLQSTAWYVLSLSMPAVSEKLTEKGKLRFASICSACHGLNAKGNKFIGAPDLTDPQWIHGGKFENVLETIKNGRQGIMPAHKDVLSKEQIHLLTAYIYSLNRF